RPAIWTRRPARHRAAQSVSGVRRCRRARGVACGVSARLSTLHVPVLLERWVDAKELATIIGVSVRTIDRFRDEGMPSETWGMTGGAPATRRYLPSECVAWAQARSRSRTVTGHGVATATPSSNDNTRRE